MRIMSRDGRAMTTFFEGRRNEAYQDGGGVWTIGVGATGPGIRKGLRWEDWEIEERFSADLDKAEDAVNENVKVRLAQCQFDALCDLAFNIGTSAFANSTLVKELNRGDYHEAAPQIERWIYDDGKVVRGLQNRRKAASRLFRGYDWQGP